VSISQVIGCEGRLRNDLLCVGWGVKLYSHTHFMRQHGFLVLIMCTPYHGVDARICQTAYTVLSVELS